MNILNKKRFRLRSSVALSYNDGILSFFKTNTREMCSIAVQENIIGFLQTFDGEKTTEEISQIFDIDYQALTKIVTTLNGKNILIENDLEYPEQDIKNSYRLINFLEEYCKKTSEVLLVLKKISSSVVLVFGLGGVGSWVVDCICRSGVKNFILVDDDVVDLTNLHRQDFFTLDMVGKYKIDCIEKKLQEIFDDVKCIKLYKKLDRNFFKDFSYSFDLAINCADHPNVDTTTRILGEECMRRNIPHIVGGGYNLHLTLIGQSIIPYQTACHWCFEKELEKINNVDVKKIKKLYRKTRKIGSFAPLCTISASITALEAIKILCGFYSSLTSTSKRIEFGIHSMNFSSMEIPRNPDCPICSKNNVE